MTERISLRGKDFTDFDVESASSSKRALTLVLVGRSGNGKSATGNSILGRKAFKAGSSSVGVTKTCELQTAKLKHGQMINVIDTPGLSGLSNSTEPIMKEILRCVTLAKQGIQAVLLVFSVRSRLSQEEEYTLQILQTLFGSEIVNHVIVVFTGGDELEVNEETLEEFLDRGCPQFLKDFLKLCNNRLVLFDNNTDDTDKKNKQVEKLLALVQSVVSQNGGKPYMDDLLLYGLKRKQEEGEEGGARTKGRERESGEEERLSREEIQRLRMMMNANAEEEHNVYRPHRRFQPPIAGDEHHVYPPPHRRFQPPSAEDEHHVYPLPHRRFQPPFGGCRFL